MLLIELIQKGKREKYIDFVRIYKLLFGNIYVYNKSSI